MNYLELCQDIYGKGLKYVKNASNPSLLHRISEVYYEYGVYKGSLELDSIVISRFPTYQNLSDVVFLAAIILKYLKQYHKAIDYLQHLFIKLPNKYI